MDEAKSQTKAQGGALKGIKVLDCSRVLAGPYCTMMLGDYGAEVIKVEAPQGDDTRRWGPPWASGESAYFLSTNRNKKSLTLNLKHKEGLSILHRLLADADVFLENFKVGTAAKMGIDFATLHEQYPKLIYCSISGYGQTGPSRHWPGYDFAIQAQGGIMSITGPASGPPSKVGVAIVDITAGLYATSAILAALHHRQHTGLGQYIDIALFDAQLGWLANIAQNALITGETPEPMGNAHPNIVPYQTFATADGWLALAIGNDIQYERFCLRAGCVSLWQDQRFQTNASRVTHRSELVPLLQEVFAQSPTAHWLKLLREASIPCAPIQDIKEALNDPQARARDMLQEVPHPTIGMLPLVGPVAKLSQTPASIRDAPPLLGQHNESILSSLGFDEDAIDALKREGVII